jgi:hypothetical protein
MEECGQIHIPTILIPKHIYINALLMKGWVWLWAGLDVSGK